MLAIKGLKKSKLILYLIIIFVMLGGSIFIIYKNMVLTTPAENQTVDVYNYEALDEGADGAVNEDNATGANESISVQKKPVAAGIIDLSLLSDAKFKSLKENSVEQEEAISSGRKNPFTPF